MPTIRPNRCVTAVCVLGLAAAGTASTAAAAKPKPPALRPGTYAGTVTMGPVYQAPGSSASITLTGTWALKVDRLGHITGSESLSGTMPITPSGNCTASPSSYTLGFAARFGIKQIGFGITGAPGAVQGKVVVIDLDSQTGSGSTTDQGWSATPATYQLTCGNLAPTTNNVLFFGELGVPIDHHTTRLPLGLFSDLGRKYAFSVGNAEGTVFTQTYTLTKRPG